MRSLEVGENLPLVAEEVITSRRDVRTHVRYGRGRAQPSLNADRSTVVRLQTRLDVEAMAVTTRTTEMPEAVARLAQLVPPARVDLVDEVLSRVGRRDLGRTLDWPPVGVVHQLIYRVKQVHLGEAVMRGPNGIQVDVISYVDKMQQMRRVFRLKQNGVLVGEYKTVDELGRKVDLAELVEGVDALRDGHHHDDQGAGSSCS